MSGRLIIRPAVVDDLDSISDYLAVQSIDVAERFLDACRDDFRKLADMPGMGRLREFDNPKLIGLRSWPVSGFSNYLIFYRPIETGVEVLQVLHGARDIDAFFDESEDDAK